MSEFMDYKTLEVWKKSRDLANLVYKATKGFPNSEIYGLVSQMRRSAISVPSNIAEGIGRNSPKETIQFLSISRGSIFELETQVYISYDQEFTNAAHFQSLLQIEECKKLLNGFINYFKQKNLNLRG
jgi:four helix bundle protein